MDCKLLWCDHGGGFGMELVEVGVGATKVAREAPKTPRDQGHLLQVPFWGYKRDERND